MSVNMEFCDKLSFIFDDGGRTDAGFKGNAGDCVCRSVAIVTGKPYLEVYKVLADGAGNERKSRGRSARNGIHTKRQWFKDHMRALGFVWTPTMGIGTGCKVHLHDGELPMGRLVVKVSKHYTAVVDGVIRDTFDPRREAHVQYWDGRNEIQRRCVYGYWTLASA